MAIAAAIRPATGSPIMLPGTNAAPTRTAATRQPFVIHLDGRFCRCQPECHWHCLKQQQRHLLPSSSVVIVVLVASARARVVASASVSFLPARRKGHRPAGRVPVSTQTPGRGAGGRCPHPFLPPCPLRPCQCPVAGPVPQGEFRLVRTLQVQLDVLVEGFCDARDGVAHRRTLVPRSATAEAEVLRRIARGAYRIGEAYRPITISHICHFHAPSASATCPASC